MNMKILTAIILSVGLSNTTAAHSSEWLPFVESTDGKVMLRKNSFEVKRNKVGSLILVGNFVSVKNNVFDEASWFAIEAKSCVNRSFPTSIIGGPFFAGATQDIVVYEMPSVRKLSWVGGGDEMIDVIADLMCDVAEAFSLTSSLQK
jgi:hypothetical protein